MKRINSIVLFLIVSLISVGFSYTTSNKREVMITRHDKDESEFLKLAKKFEKYICHLNLPDCEGTIVADQWVLSAAHCAVGITQKFENGRKHFVIIDDVEIEVDKVIMYKEWDDPQADNSLLKDIALLHLKTKPIDAMQAKLYVDEDEVDKLVYMVGRGNKGDGLIGINGNDGKQRGATNRIETATKNWLTWTFDHPDTQTKYLTEFEGISGPGDSGGPAFIVKNNTVYLAGISSWQDTKGGDEGLYGVVENYTRVSQYIQWINEEMTGNGNVSEAILRVEPKPDATVYEPKIISVNAGTLKKYVGEYEISGNIMRVHTKENDTKIYLFVSEGQEYEFVPTGEHEFSSEILEGYKLEFKNEKNGIFKKLIIIQPDVTYELTRK
ncbi:trypsin-like serine protease [Aquimarina sp. MMG015]|uniref:S1 family peptidase n=1 Tax=Aquimarina sp. MMG015 TaxID=2822689 RepID=UPI001B3A7ADF|nr:trypsin-like serine protease [Aquimarina sp. MMG015]MBQ4804688.1 trypsin-like serine protease [Aquimarina sp. MMG015]